MFVLTRAGWMGMAVGERGVHLRCLLGTASGGVL